MHKRVWITWEKQRRSIELAASLGCKLFVIGYHSPFRYLKCIFKTITIVRHEKPSIILVQNPSMLLALLATCVLKPLFKFPVIVDRHSNFLLTTQQKLSFVHILLRLMSFISIRKADITIVTNEDLGHVIKVDGGNVFVLPDKIPIFNDRKIKKKDRPPSVLLISSFGRDEPIEDVWEASRILEHDNVNIFVSGNYRKLPNKLIKNKPNNVILTGFLEDQKFIDLLFNVDVIMVLTKAEYTLLCGCYEALAAEKPLITSDTKVLKELFEEAIFVSSSPVSIATAIRTALNDVNFYASKTKKMKRKISSEWAVKIAEFNKIIYKLEGS